VIEALYKRGIAAHIMFKVYNKFVNWPAKGSTEDGLYFLWIIAPYAAFQNVVWDFSKEAQNERDLDYKLGRLRFIRQHDPYRHLLTVHDDTKTYRSGAYDELLVPRPITTFRFWLFAKTGLGAPGGIFWRETGDPQSAGPRQPKATEAMTHAFLRGACSGESSESCAPETLKH